MQKVHFTDAHIGEFILDRKNNTWIQLVFCPLTLQLLLINQCLDSRYKLPKLIHFAASAVSVYFGPDRASKVVGS